MANIRITRAHTKGLKAARVAAEKAAQHLDKRFGLEYAWSETEKDTLEFERSGFEGKLKCAKDKVDIDVKVGLLGMAIKPLIEQEINKELDTLFGKA